MAPTQHTLSCRGSDVHVRVSVNDVPVLVRKGPASFIAAVPINAWLGDPVTHLRFELSGALADGQPVGTFEAELSGRVAGSDPKTILKTKCPGDYREHEMVIRGDQWIFRRTLEVSDLALPPSEFWPSASAIVLSDTDRIAIHELVMGLQRAYDEADGALLQEALSFQHAEIARAQHVSPEEVSELFLASLMLALGDEEVAVDPTSEEALTHLDESMQVHLVGRDRLVWVTRDEFAPVLWVPAMQPKFRMPLYLAKRDQQWSVVR